MGGSVLLDVLFVRYTKLGTFSFLLSISIFFVPKKFVNTVVVAQLVEWSLPTLEVCCSNQVIGKKIN